MVWKEAAVVQFEALSQHVTKKSAELCLVFPHLRSTLIFTEWPLGSTTRRSMEPASMSGGVSSVTGSGGVGAIM